MYQRHRISLRVRLQFVLAGGAALNWYLSRGRGSLDHAPSKTALPSCSLPGVAVLGPITLARNARAVAMSSSACVEGP